MHHIGFSLHDYIEMQGHRDAAACRFSERGR